MALLQSFITRLVICLIALFAYCYLFKKKELGFTYKPTMSSYNRLLYTILAQLAMTSASILWTSIEERVWPSVERLIIPFNGLHQFFFHGVLQVVCLAAISEELLFRAILPMLLRKIISGDNLIATIAALTFSIMHGQVKQIPIYFIMGYFFNVLYKRTTYIIYPILAHGLHNLLIVSIIYFGWEELFRLCLSGFPIMIRSIWIVGCLWIAYWSLSYIKATKRKKTSRSMPTRNKSLRCH